MNQDPEIVPHKITKPIQLLAAWLAGLAIVNASFLTAAGLIHSPPWIPGLLAIAAVVNVPVFIASLFLLQTKFRPEMQEDTFYSKYLERKYSSPPMSREPVDIEKQFAQLADKIVAKVTTSATDKRQAVVSILKESEVPLMAERFRNNRTLSELHLYKADWEMFHEIWRENADFQAEFAELSAAGLVIAPSGVVRNAVLSPLGAAVAEHLAAKGELWNQLPAFKDVHERDIKEQKAKTANRKRP